jgi:AraC-like DNA-binding protein
MRPIRGLRGLIMRTLLTTEHVPSAERLARFAEVLSQDTAPAEPYVEDDGTSISGRIEAGALGSIAVLQVTSHSQARRGLRRDLKLISRSDPDDFRLTFPLHGPFMLDHNDRQIELAPGYMTLADTSRPYDAWHQLGSGGFLLFAFPKHDVPLSRKYVDKLVGARLSGQSGIGRLLRTVATQTARDLDTYDPDEAAHLSTVLLDLVSGMLAHELGATRELPGESQQQVMRQRVHAFIRRHLADPGLTPMMIAEAHHISVRTLHRLFESSGCTIVEWIRTQRLHRCRRDLADAMSADQPIHEIASRWGFVSHPHFTRSFRAHYGMSPLEYRQTATSRPVPDNPLTAVRHDTWDGVAGPVDRWTTPGW